MTMTDAEIAKENDKIMGHLSICRECALENGGSLFPEHIVCTWIGTCKRCGKVKDCHHMRDFALNPKRFVTPDIAVGG